MSKMFYSRKILCLFLFFSFAKAELSTGFIEKAYISNGNNNELQGGGGHGGVSGLLPYQIDENCYFIDAKRIRISVRNKVTDILEKKEVTVHIDCFKQLEKIKGQKLSLIHI